MQPKIKLLRFSVVLVLFIGLLFFFLGKLAFFQFFRSSFLLKLAAKQHTYYLELEPQRGSIFDRQMRPLAINVPTFSLYAVPPQVKNINLVAESLNQVLGLEKSFILERLGRQKQFIWLARKLDMDKMDEIRAMDFDGLYFIKESKRSYPNSRLASQTIGFAGIDNVGLDGLEMHYDSYLKGTPGWTFVLRDARRRDLALSDVLQPPVDGYSLVLTIDQVVQYIAEREIEKIYQKYNAKGATIVVVDVKTGEILALANRPTLDLNEPSKYPTEARRNRAVTDFFEPGSVFKIVTASAALDTGKFTPEDKIFCENGEYRVANHTLHDVHPYGLLPFKEVISQSSNIGTTKIAQKIGAQPVYDYAKAFGFGVTTSSGLPGEVAGVLKPVSRWSKTSVGAVPIGQEVCVTALQLASAIAAIANDGVYMKPFIVREIIDKRGEVIKSFEPQVVRNAVSIETSKMMREILANVVETGTGKLAQSKFYRFGGKTGTAQKVESNGTYSHSKFMASFIGFAPVENPEIAIAVIVDEPRPYYYGGVVSAPAFKFIAEDVLKYRQMGFNRKGNTVLARAYER
ncbi:MAG: penicillin-binding protein [Candidatus Omnitrophica bacterium]|nr:penicillin-binding protein [Candidatus Omnitrophota bacterium]